MFIVEIEAKEVSKISEKVSLFKATIKMVKNPAQAKFYKVRNDRMDVMYIVISDELHLSYSVTPYGKTLRDVEVKDMCLKAQGLYLETKVGSRPKDEKLGILTLLSKTVSTDLDFKWSKKIREDKDMSDEEKAERFIENLTDEELLIHLLLLLPTIKGSKARSKVTIKIKTLMANSVTLRKRYRSLKVK